MDFIKSPYHVERRLRPNASRVARAGFTLVELLVVIAIIGILVGLLLPAVQAAREAARRANCLNNMIQLGLGVHHFEFNAEHFPAGVISPDGPIRNEPIGQHVSWIVQVLPFIEEQPAYNRFDIEQGAYAAVNAPVREHAIAILQCPSDPDPFRLELDVSTYVGCHHDQEAPIAADNNGMLFLNSRVRFRDILDGSSHTILLGESYTFQDDLGWVSGTRSTLRNTGRFETQSPLRVAATAPTAGEEPNSLSVGPFGSYHPGGANFIFADGSARFLSQNIEPETFQHLGNRADGEMLELY